MQTAIYVGLGVLITVLVAKILWDLGNRIIIKKKWPTNLSKDTLLEYWYLYSVAGVEFYRVRKESKRLVDEVRFFLAGYSVPADCNKANPVVVLYDFTSGTDDLKVMSKNFFMRNFTKYITFNSFNDYEKYMKSTD